MSKKIFIGSGFTDEQFLWILPIVFNYAKLKKINTIIIENKIKLEKIILDKNFYKDFNIIFLDFSKKKKIILLVKSLFRNINIFLNIVLNIKKKQLLNKKISWELSQCLHGLWDQINLRSNHINKISIRSFFVSLIKGMYKYELGNYLKDKEFVTTVFLSHSVYSDRFLLANLRKNQTKIFTQAVTNLHRQKKIKDTSWSDISFNNFNYFFKKKKTIEKYWIKRTKGKGNYQTANDSVKILTKEKINYEKFNIIFLHIFKDSPFNVIDRTRIFEDYYEWILKTLYILKNSDEIWCIKLHPASYRWGENQKEILYSIFQKVFGFSSIPTNIIILDNESSSLYYLSKANKIVTFSGTCHIEAIAIGKKPIVICQSPISRFLSNGFYRPKKIEYYKNMLLSKKNINEKQTKQNIYNAKVFLYIRENFYSLSSVINNDDIYKNDNVNKRLKSFNKVKNNYNINKPFFLKLSETLHKNFTHTVNFKLLNNKSYLKL